MKPNSPMKLHKNDKNYLDYLNYIYVCTLNLKTKKSKKYPLPHPWFFKLNNYLLYTDLPQDYPLPHDRKPRIIFLKEHPPPPPSPIS